eukprot:1720-Heterococcus_DN1.PRE.1
MQGYGPYAELPDERRAEVMDRTCEKYMSLLLSSDSRSSSNAAATAHIRRYEFVALIRWNNHALHDDLISTGVLLARVKSVQDAAKDGRFSEDEWLSPDAPWRLNTWHYTSGIVLDGIDESQVAWYWRKGSSSAHSSSNSVKTPWVAFSKSTTAGDECLRLERRYRQFMEQHKAQVQHTVAARHRSRPSYTGTVNSTTTAAITATDDATASATAGGKSDNSNSESLGSVSTATPESRTTANTDATDADGDSSADGTGTVGTEAVVDDTMDTATTTAANNNGATTGSSNSKQQSQAPLVVLAVMSALSNKANAISTTTDNTDDTADTTTSVMNGCSTSDVVIERNDETGQIGVSGRTSTVSYQVVADGTLEVTTYTPAETDVFVDQGRRVVNLHDLHVRPVYWAYSGNGDSVRRAVWLQETGTRKRVKHIDGTETITLEYRPYPPQAAAILEDAYQYLKWYLAATDERQQQQQQTAAARATGTTTDDQSTKAAAAQQQQQPPVNRPTVWLTVQVVDQLVQFRSLTDIVSITRTLGGAVSVLGRRAVHRGLPAQQSNAQSATAAATTAASTTASSSTDATTTAATSATASTPTKASVITAAAATTAATGSCGNGEVQAVEPDVDADLNEHVSHLILVVHGIGDALSTMDLGVVQLRSLVDCCNNMRAQHAEVVEASPHLHALKHHHRSNSSSSNGTNVNAVNGVDSTTASATKKAATAAHSKTAVDGRVEYLPIEWHSRFKTKLDAEGKCGRDGTSNSSGVSDEQLSIWDITLKRAATLRAYTNDTVLDVLYFMSPEYHQIIVQEVTAE